MVFGFCDLRSKTDLRSQNADLRSQIEDLKSRSTTRPSLYFCLFTFHFLLVLNFHVHDVFRATIFQKLGDHIMIEAPIARFDNQEERIARSQREVRRIKYRMIGLRQLVERQHSQHSCKRRHQDGALESDRNERGPTVVGFTADIQRVILHFHPVLHEETTQSTENSSNQNNQRQAGVMKTDSL